MNLYQLFSLLVAYYTPEWSLSQLFVQKTWYKSCTSDEEEVDAALAEVVAAHVDHELHVGVPEEGRLALRARLVIHFNRNEKISQRTSTDFVFVVLIIVRPSA